VFPVSCKTLCSFGCLSTIPTRPSIPSDMLPQHQNPSTTGTHLTPPWNPTPSSYPLKRNQTQFPHGSQSSAPLPSSKQTSLPVPLTYYPADAPAKPNQTNPRTHLPLACNLSAACLAFSRATLSSSSVACNSASIAAASSSSGSAGACRMPDMASAPSG
jgi:hypothetical protein